MNIAKYKHNSADEKAHYTKYILEVCSICSTVLSTYKLYIFMQVTFLVAGFMAMILMEWIGIKTVGPDAHSVMNTSSELRICTLNHFQPEWTLPMNFTCNKNITDLNPLINGT